MKTCIATASIPRTLREKLAALAAADRDGIARLGRDITAEAVAPRDAARMRGGHGPEPALFQPFRDLPAPAGPTLPAVEDVSAPAAALREHGLSVQRTGAEDHDRPEARLRPGRRPTRRPPGANSLRDRGGAGDTFVQLQGAADASARITVPKRMPRHALMPRL